VLFVFRACSYGERGKGCGFRAAGGEIGARAQRHGAYLPQAFSVSITQIINAISGQLPD